MTRQPHAPGLRQRQLLAKHLVDVHARYIGATGGIAFQRAYEVDPHLTVALDLLVEHRTTPLSLLDVLAGLGVVTADDLIALLRRNMAQAAAATAAWAAGAGTTSAEAVLCAVTLLDLTVPEVEQAARRCAERGSW